MKPPRGAGWIDLAILSLLAAFIYAVVTVAHQWQGPLQPAPEIHLELRYLPLYGLFSLTRGVLAYGVSLAFTMVYGYAMARVAGAERVLLPLLDILQSLPVLAFLPGFVLALVQLFPHRNVGLELASVLMIFTGQVWNLTLSFAASLKAVPPDLVSVARLARMSWWERFIRLDLSFAAPGLLWNSMLSMAGGWFFLMVSEAFVLGRQDFRLPGLGSYMSLAIERGDGRAQGLGVLAMLAMIACLDQAVWRPLLAWSRRFTEDEPAAATDSWIWTRLRSSWLWRMATPRSEWRWPSAPLERGAGWVHAAGSWLGRAASHPWVRRGLVAAAGVGILFGAVEYLGLLLRLTGEQWMHLALSTAATFLRVVAAVLLASLWAIPLGVWIGRHPRWARVLQPLIQMAASFPAPMIFPVVVGALLAGGIGLGISSVGLLMLATQWYIVFNTIIGTGAIPGELWEVARLARFSRWQRWRRLILPAILPSLLTGWITALGGAWNASVVAEYLTYQGRTLSTVGLGAAIHQATERGEFHVLAAAVGLMAATVVGFNRVVWRPLRHRAQTRFGLDA